MRRSFHYDFGFSLIEMMIAGLIGTFVASAVYGVMKTQVQTSTDTTQESQLLRDSQRARVRIKDDLIKAGFDPTHWKRGGDAFGPITTASNDRIILKGDFNQSGEIDDAGAGQDPETIDYLWDAESGQITRNGTAFLTGIENFTLTYFNSTGDSATSVPDAKIDNVTKIKKVKFQWESVKGSNRATYEVTVTLPNYRSGT